MSDRIGLARTAQAAGIDTVLLPTGREEPDPWMLAAALAAEIPDIRLMIGLQVGSMLPVVAAHLAQSMQSLSAGRLILQMELDEAVATGRDYLNHAQRLERCGEFLAIFRALRQGVPLEFRGTYFQAENAQLPDLNASLPPVYWLPKAADEYSLASRHCDGLLFRCFPPATIRQQIADAWRRLAGTSPDERECFYSVSSESPGTSLGTIPNGALRGKP
jgi:alkanesulfonate monooxygenase SsuD/methylene tetrahydromethanopterin reductase-like flavin-dependent oxidoreductase (luciferase family)